MLKVAIGSRYLKKVLCLGAHCDDIEIGCGGSILKLVENRKNLEVCWVVFSSDDLREKEARKSANAFLRNVKRKRIEINKFRNSFFPFQGTEIKEYFERLKQDISPDLIFTHHGSDLHQDHRLISELTWNTFRDHLILEYEIPKFDGDLGSPNFFVHLDESFCKSKTEMILKYFNSQNDKRWFTKDTFFSLLRLRGVESNAPGRFAEGFYCRKIIF